MGIKLTKKKKAQYNLAETKVRMSFDRTILNLFIGYIFTQSKYITRANLINLNNLMTAIDISLYEKDVTLYSRIKFIKLALEAKLKRGLEHEDIIINYCLDENEPEFKNIVDELSEYKKQLNYNEIRYLNKTIVDRLHYAFIIYYKDLLTDIFLRIDTNEYKTLEDVTGQIKKVVSWLQNDIRRTESITAMDTFDLTDDVMIPFIETAIEEANNPSNKLKTGIQMLNTLLCGGFEAKRLYLFLGISGGFKSAILLYCAKWIKLYNKVQPKRKDINSRPTVLLITMENSVQETVFRLFNICVEDVEMNNYTPKEAVKLLRTEGQLTLTSDDDIDIKIMYFGNFEINTDDLYGIIEDIENDNREVIALILDYIKRIRPALYSPDERIQLKNASNELKDLAIRLKIPVITAQQINRAGNSAVEEAIRNGKVDIAMSLGATDVALAWDLIENSDWVGIIALSRLLVDSDNQHQMYLSIKNPKCRMKRISDIVYINHPFERGSRFRLIDDIYMDEPLSITSLDSKLKNQLNKRGDKNSKERRNIDNDDSFDFTQFLQSKKEEN